MDTATTIKVPNTRNQALCPRIANHSCDCRLHAPYASPPNTAEGEMIKLMIPGLDRSKYVGS
jgi:hypothetical protein